MIDLIFITWLLLMTGLGFAWGYSYRRLKFHQRMLDRLDAWRDGVRCNCGHPKRHKWDRGDSPFTYCTRCDAFHYAEKTGKGAHA